MKSIKVIEIIAEELRLPNDSSLTDILTALMMLDDNGEIKALLVHAMRDDLFKKFREEGVLK